MTPDSPSDPPLQQLDLPSGPVGWTDEGTGSPVVALHGLPGSVRDFRWLGAALPEGIRLIRIDQAGFGSTPLSTWPGATLPARADFICAVLDHLGLGPVVLIGHSMGGAVAAAVASRRPDLVRGLGLICSIGITPHRGMRQWPVPPWVISVFLRFRPVRTALMVRLSRAFEASGFKGHGEPAIVQTVHCVAWTSMALHERHLRGLERPTMVVWTRDDPLIEQAISEKLYWICPVGPRVVFDTGGHNPQKTRATELAESLASWLDLLP